MATNKPVDQMSVEELKAYAKQLEAEKAKASTQVAMTIHIGPKGTLVVNGVGSRYGVALYPESWRKLITFIPNVVAFLDANEGKMAKKGEEYKPAEA